MRTHKLTRFTSVVAALGLLASAATPVLAAPVASSAAALKSTVSTPLTQVRWRGHHHGGGGGAVAAGVIGGLLLGGIIASQANRYDGPAYYYDGPPGYYGPDYDSWVNYCFSRYRSFDPRTGTYVGYDGRRHYCR